MIPVLSNFFEHMLGYLLDAGTDRMIEGQQKCHLQKKMETADEQTRTYLAEHLDACDYEVVDAYLAKEGFYSSDKIESSPLLEHLIQTAIDDFCRKNPRLVIMIRANSPVLRQALGRSLSVLLSRLSPGERFLAQQSDMQAQRLQSELSDLRELLQKSLTDHRPLLPEQAEHICREINKAIDAGNLSVAKSCLDLMDTQLDSEERYRWTACRIRLDALHSDSGNAYHFCERLLHESPDPETVEMLVTWLVAIEDFSSLRSIRPLVPSDERVTLLDLILAQNTKALLRTCFDADGILKPEYLQDEQVLWAAGNTSLSLGAGYAALSFYQAVEALRGPSVWLRWKMCCARYLIACHPVSFCGEGLDEEAIDTLIQDIMRLSPFFEQTGDHLFSQYIEQVFACAELRCGDKGTPEYPWDRLSQRAQQLPIVQKYRYHEQLNTGKTIDAQELRAFCQKHQYDSLWAEYLIRHSQAAGDDVIAELENHPEFFQRSFLYTEAYAHALVHVRGVETALDQLRSLSLPPHYELSKAVLLADLSARFGSSQASALLDRVFETANPKPLDRVYIVDIQKLVSLLTNADRHQDALTVLERYQPVSPVFGRLRLDLLLRQDGAEDACGRLLDKLLLQSPNDPFLLYCQGFLREKEGAGTGRPFFQKAFDLAPTATYATALLAARINCHDVKEDEALEFCRYLADSYAQYLCGRSYLQMGKADQGRRCILYGLLLCGNDIRDDLALYYVQNMIRDDGHAVPPDTVGMDTAVVLTSQDDHTVRRLWLHSDKGLIPVGGSTFADYEHVSAAVPEAILLFHRRVGDMITLEDRHTYTITAINYGDVVALQCCFQSLIRHGKIIQGSVSQEDPQKGIAELLSHLDSGETARQQVRELYAKRKPGLTLTLFQHCYGRPYYEFVQGVLCDPSIPFWAGGDSSALRRDCLLTGSTLAVLGTLGIQPPKEPHAEFTIWITPLTRHEVIDEITMFQQSPLPAGSIGKTPDGKPFFVENTEELQNMRQAFYACMSAWCSYAKTTAEVSPEDYLDELRKLQKAFHPSEIEAVTLARSAPYVVLSDDLQFRQYLHANNIPNATATELLAELATTSETLLRGMEMLQNCRYYDSVTLGLLRKLSTFFYATLDDEALEDISVRTIPLIHRYIGAPNLRYELFSAVKLAENSSQFHETLQWIINQSLLLYAQKHPDEFPPPETDR